MPDDESARGDAVPDEFGIEVDVLFVVGGVDEHHSCVVDFVWDFPASGVCEVLDDILQTMVTVVGSDFRLGNEVSDHFAAGIIVLLGQDVDGVAAQAG